jgi:hypothetical protein
LWEALQRRLSETVPWRLMGWSSISVAFSVYVGNTGHSSALQKDAGSPLCRISHAEILQPGY